MRRSLLRGIVMGFMVLGFVAPSRAGIPQELAFQGKLTDQSGRPLDGTYTVTFRLYDAAVGGTKLWEESKSLSAPGGLFSTLLGSGTPLTLAFDQPYWVEIQVGAEILDPRRPLSSSPYALRAQKLEGVNVVNGKVGIGTTDPSGYLPPTLHVRTAGAADNNFFEGAVHVGGAAEALGGQLSYHNYSSGRVSLVNLNDANSAASTLSLGFGSINLATGRPNDETMTLTSNGNVGIGTAAPQAKLEVNSTLRLTPAGAPAAPKAGMIYFNSADKRFYGYNGTAWKRLDN